ncbi:sensor histidine kinase [Leifsonia flava]|uniref:histidine kinase n=1 Tax=Orlajensenia leifsoniae TaxID=2561933 RepID=A0A4Y9R6D1_9MICO|nr:sensor histidine kinase [Leifsonia flava]TFV99223.1 sensor histidine kinase [Leifsonia flava]
MPSSERWSHPGAPGADWTGPHRGPWGRWMDDDPRPLRRVRWFAVVFSQLVQLPVLVWLVVSGADGALIAASVVAFAASYLLLLLPRYPGPTVAVVALAIAPALVIVPFGPPFAAVPLAFAVVQATARGARVWVWSTIGAGVIAALAYGTVSGEWASLVRSLIVLLVLSILVGAGEAARSRIERYRGFREQQLRARQSEAELERLRIARELHDVLAHSLSSINVQAGMGLHLMESQPEKAAEALANIKETSRTALDEVRGVLGFLRSGDDSAPLVPEPGLARLPALAASLEALGVTVTLQGHLSADPPTATDRTIYRIVQEALTNVTRHSEARTALVELSTVDGVDIVTISDSGTGHGGDPIEEGRGFLGMRERAALVGGTVSAGWQPGGGLRLEVRIPRREEALP